MIVDSLEGPEASISCPGHQSQAMERCPLTAATKIRALDKRITSVLEDTSRLE